MNVLLATDGSDTARSAEALVAGIPWPQGSLVEILAIDEVLPGDIEFPADAFAALHDEMTRALEAHVGKAAEAIRRPQVTIATKVLSGRPASLIVDEAGRARADLVIVGSHGRGRIASALLGSVAAEVVDHAHCPVLVARRAALRRIVLADDGSPGSRRAADFVAGTPAFGAVPIHVVSVLNLPALSAPGLSAEDATGGLAIIDALMRHHTRIAREGAERLAAAGVVATSEVREGGVTRSLIDAAAAVDADLIVVGSRGTTGLERVLLGSVARSVLVGAPCSVLVVHPTR